MTLTIGGGTVVGPAGTLIVDDGLIVATGASGAIDVDARGGWVVPGFIDVQINGAHGIDVTTEPHRIDELAAVLPRYGVTSFLPTVITCAPDGRAAALAAWSDRRGGSGAVPLGLHLEGPMLAPARKGAHPAEHLVAPGSDVIAGWSPDAGVVMATIAPELAGATEVIAALTARGVVVSIGHTDCTAAEFSAGRAAGRGT